MALSLYTDNNYPKSTEDLLRATITQCEKAIEQLDKDTDEEFKRLKWVERDFTTNDNKTQYFFMVKLAPSPTKEDFWHVDVSDGFSREGSSHMGLDSAYNHALQIINKNFHRNKKQGWIHNKKEDQNG